MMLLIGLVAFLVLFTYFIPIGLWVSAAAAQVYVGLLTLVGMRLRRIPPPLIINSLVSARKAGLSLDTDVLEAHFLAGGDVNKVVLALIAADKANIELEFQRAAAIDLAGRDVLDAVKMSVNPRVIETPKVSAIAKDGIQLFSVA
ncbi:MAG: flotillin-like FloA family protein, partial [Candidatus Marinimicrobia bacterium]|nr:flotillin-like FloA family protein [Candidatus Neomarinimicrobiota bacterium]